ncbi:MAG: hypothetical protein CM1200mP14_02600 [Gammaproteobacteria bacterium]|nr:MAG: hypothetical protein CM1200mP14_02600 [Gammaproteobacteria bacterium]
MKSHKTEDTKRVTTPEPLERQLGLRDVYALATGATLSSGFFLLPGLAAASAGSAMPLAYLLGAIILYPAYLVWPNFQPRCPELGGFTTFSIEAWVRSWGQLAVLELGYH